MTKSRRLRCISDCILHMVKMKVLPLTMGLSDRTYRFNKCLSFLCIYWNSSNEAEAKLMLRVNRQQHSFVGGKVNAMLQFD